MTHQAPICILITDDHPVVRQGLRAVISTRPDMAVVGEAENGFEAVEQARLLQPDVILMDMVMPGMGGLEAIGEITRENAAARILVLTSFAEDDQIFPAIKAGAIGYLLKDAPSELLLEAICDVHAGLSSLHPAIALKLIQELQSPSDLPPAETPLTKRELDVLRLIAKGLTNQNIAERLVLSEGTVRIHVSNILNKLHLANRTQAALYALQEGLASLD